MSRAPNASVGGQAVLEGVMMRAPNRWAVAVRRPDGVIEAVAHELPRLSSRSRWARIPFFRGVMVLVESLQLGFRALSWSAQKSGEEDEELTRGQVWLTMAFAIVFALVLFVGAPVVAADFLKRFLNDSSIGFVIIDGVIRIVLIVGYIWAISRAKEIQRVFEYHGAEHMTIHAYESGDPLTLDAISGYSPRHPRCGTSFIIIVALVAFFVFLLLAPLAFVWQVVARIVMIPVIAGASYEVLKAAAGKKWMAFASKPGMWLQAITTRQPDSGQIEVAVASLLAALTEEERHDVDERGPVVAGALEVEYSPESI
ncbi:MAG TPA: DUF1385 domain-containing protein [Acidimicrobiia bacterium]|nr:DUF1385 domain-containing protein [Acidimicrobiia bacterium]